MSGSKYIFTSVTDISFMQLEQSYVILVQQAINVTYLVRTCNYNNHYVYIARVIMSVTMCESNVLICYSGEYYMVR